MLATIWGPMRPRSDVCKAYRGTHMSLALGNTDLLVMHSYECYDDDTMVIEAYGRE